MFVFPIGIEPIPLDPKSKKLTVIRRENFRRFAYQTSPSVSLQSYLNPAEAANCGLLFSTWFQVKPGAKNSEIYTSRTVENLRASQRMVSARTPKNMGSFTVDTPDSSFKTLLA